MSLSDWEYRLVRRGSIDLPWEEYRGGYSELRHARAARTQVSRTYWGRGFGYQIQRRPVTPDWEVIE